MATNLSSKEFELFREYIEKNCGIIINKDKSYLIESRLSRLLVTHGFDRFEELYKKVYLGKDQALQDQVIDGITTNETLWFRDKSPWVVLREVLLPRYVEALRKGEKKKIRIWSAASSTGQEAYSTAIAIDEYLWKNGVKGVTLEDFEIVGTDISKPVIEIARKARYDAISIMRGLDPKYKEKYFSNEGRTWILTEDIKRIVTFKPFNLQSSFWSLGKFDAVFLRYVLIYFSKSFKQEILEKVHGALAEEGVLFLGNSEIMQENEGCFEQKKHEKGIYYSKGRCKN